MKQIIFFLLFSMVAHAHDLKLPNEYFDGAASILIKKLSENSNNFSDENVLSNTKIFLDKRILCKNINNEFNFLLNFSQQQDSLLNKPLWQKTLLDDYPKMVWVLAKMEINIVLGQYTEKEFPFFLAREFKMNKVDHAQWDKAFHKLSKNELKEIFLAVSLKLALSIPSKIPQAKL